MAEQRRFVVTSGMGRCGTAWLAQALAVNTTAKVVHEASHADHWPARWKDWMDLQGEMVGNVDGYARIRLHRLVQDLPPETRWAFIVREPCAWVRSLAVRGPQRTLMLAAHVIFGGCEITLLELSKLGIKAEPFCMEHLLTEDGLLSLIDYLELTRAETPGIGPNILLPPPTNATADWGNMAPAEEWPQHVREVISSLPSKFPKTKAAYKKALAKAKECGVSY